MSDRTGASIASIQKQSTRWWQWWPMLLGFLGMAFCIVAFNTGHEEWYAKRLHEILAIIICSIGLLAAVMKLALVRHRFYVLLSLLAFFVLFREIHIDGTKKVIYVAVAGLTVWAYFWRGDLVPFINAQASTRIWLTATATTYVLSQFVARRGFQYLMPGESYLEGLFDELYDDMEEVLENIGHVMLLITALVGPWKPTRPTDHAPRSDAPAE